MTQRASRFRQQARLETLEDRAMLSTCFVTRIADTGQGNGFRGDLRYCINKVNSEPGADVIQINPTGTINLASALPDLTTEMDIQGPGASLLTVRRNTGGDYRIFTVASGADVKLSGLTITNGKLTSGANGGGISNAGVLELDSVMVTSNEAQGPVANGGGVYNLSTGVLTIINSVVSSNDAMGLTAGSSIQGGGISNLGVMSISRSTIAANDASSNSGTEDGGGIFTVGSLTISDSTISGNSSSPSPFGDLASGGGIAIWGGTTTITNCTISANRADDGGSGSLGGGGGIYLSGGTLTINHSTIANNFTLGKGGGIWRDFGTLNLRNTILAKNDAVSTSEDLSGTLASSGYNVIGISAGGSGYSATDILNVNPLLGALLSNGGPTQTHALLLGSPAIDAGNNTNAPPWDQRGEDFPRIVNGTIDIGAFEVQATGAPTSPDLLALLITMDFERDD